MSGPAPKPTALKRLAGNPGKRPLNGDEPVFEPEVPSAPRHLNAVAQREWRRVARGLADAGVLTKMDRATLAAYCANYARWAEAENKLRTDGMVDKTPNGMAVQGVWLQISNKAQVLMLKFAQELGLTPAARTRVRVEKVEAKKSLAEILFDGVADGRGG